MHALKDNLKLTNENEQAKKLTKDKDEQIKDKDAKINDKDLQIIKLT